MSPTRTDATARCALCGITKAYLVEYRSSSGLPIVLCKRSVQCRRRRARTTPTTTPAPGATGAGRKARLLPGHEGA